VNKEGFNKLVSDYSDVDKQFQDLEKLVDRFPYSQPLRMLSMKSSTKLSKVEYQKRLGLAAFYSTDRNVLRSLVEDGLVPSDRSHKKVVVKQVKDQTPIIAKKIVTKVKKSTVDADILRNEVLANLEELQKSKAHFLEITEQGEVEIVERKAPQLKKKELASAKAKKPKAKSTSEKAIQKSIKAKPKASRSRTKKDDIIDKFIADEPSITPNQKPQENQSDLSKPSSVLKEDLVSENLAIIFANQGKASKAIEIYKKLIWKFPQKKASFAARIEELKKK
jgi:tetratricopeptide (TPR) repeat protein